MSKVYFITGAQGCIGSWIVKQLVERGDVPVVFDKSDDPRRLKAIINREDLARVVFVNGDITDGAIVTRALADSGARQIIHLAGLQVPICKANPQLGAMVNVVGTLNIFEAARTSEIKQVVYASSAAVFGMSELDEAVDESKERAPVTHYGVFKLTNEGNARIYYQDNGISSAGLRPLTVYGVNRDFGVTSDPTKAMKSAVLGRRFHIRFGGATDFQFAADTAAAFIACADKVLDGAYVFNLHGETVQVSDLVEMINELSPVAAEPLITFGGSPIPIAPTMSDAAFRRTIGETQSTSLADGIKQTMDRFAELRDSGELDTSDLAA